MTLNESRTTRRLVKPSRLLFTTISAALMASIILLSTACDNTRQKPSDHDAPTVRAEQLDAMSTRIAVLEEKVEELRRPRANPNDSTVTLFQGDETLGTSTVTIDALVGDKPVIINFWAAQASPSRAELTEFQEFYEEYRDEVLILLVDAGQFTGQGTPGQALDLLKELGVTVPAGYAENPAILQTYQILGLPTTLFIDSEGQIHHRWTGTLNKQVLVENTRAMLGYKPRVTTAASTTSPQTSALPTHGSISTAAPAATAAPATTAAAAPQPTAAPAATAPIAVYHATPTASPAATAVAVHTATTAPKAYNCDDVLRNQLVFQRNASTAGAMNAIIAIIQNQRGDQCSLDLWNPTVIDTTTTPQYGGCPAQRVIGTQDVPSGLHEGTSNLSVQLKSGRDRDNNIIVHWHHEKRPADNARCWLYVAGLRTWSVE